jgi:hypothetical protein
MRCVLTAHIIDGIPTGNQSDSMSMLLMSNSASASSNAECPAFWIDHDIPSANAIMYSPPTESPNRILEGAHNFVIQQPLPLLMSILKQKLMWM